MKKSDKLLQKIAIYNEAYRAGKPIISDQEYDGLIEELHKIDPENEWFKHIEPAHVGANRKVKLPVPMKSLNKAKDILSLKKWIQSIGLSQHEEVIVMPKFDGLSILHDERTNNAYSRGGAENEGQDCSRHYQASNKITNTDSEFEFTFGEFVFSREAWADNFEGKVSPETGDRYKSPRNTAAGLLNRDEASQNLKHIDFYRYGADEGSLEGFATYEEFYKRLCHVFQQPEIYCRTNIHSLTTESCLKMYEEWSKLYYIDGLVIYVNNLEFWKITGRDATTGNPKYAIAYKDPDFTDVFETVVEDVLWKVSKAGALKPVVKIKTVDTGDCNMENPTGYNAKWVLEHHIAKGARIQVTRSGGVIPKILCTIESAPVEEEKKLWKLLDYCPHCGSATKWNDKQIELCCSNKKCNGVQLAKIIFFFKTIGVENIGEETLNKMFEAGFTKIKEILNITFDELIEIDGFGESTANQVLSAVSIIKNGLEITYLMHASDCFVGIGQIKAKSILLKLSEEQRFALYNGMFHTWGNNDELKERDFFKAANTTLQSFMLGIIPFYQFVAENELQIIPMAIPQNTAGGIFSDVKVCFTGIRDTTLEEHIASNGGEIVNGVSKKTTHLIVGSKDSSSSKTRKAKQNGIPIMTIGEFKNQFQI